MKRLIVNADDFGLHGSVNDGIIKGFTEGIIRSTSLLASGDAFDEAVLLAKANPALGIGIHTALVGGLETVSAPHTIPSLLNERGLLPETHVEFIKRVYTGKVDFNEVYRELDKQFEKIVSSGVNVTHVDGHQHMHVLPPVLDIVITLMKRYGIHKIRIPNEDVAFANGVFKVGRLIGKAGLTAVATKAKYKTDLYGFLSPRYFWGMVNGGGLNEKALLAILRKVSKRIGTHEIMTHPGTSDLVLSAQYGWGYHWESELAAMCSPHVRDFIKARGIHLCSYAEYQ